MDIWDKIEENIDKRANKDNNINYGQNTIIKKRQDTELISIIITRSGTYIENINSLKHETIKKIQNYYTLSDKTIMGYFKKTPNWELKPNRLYIPRFGSLFLNKKFNNIKYTNEITSNNHLPHMNYIGKFNGNQEIIYNNIMQKTFSPEYASLGKSGLILNLMAGHGKTFLAMAIINQIKSRTLIVVHNSSILDQWVKLLNEYFPDITVGQYYGKKKVYGDIVVGVINSLVMPEIKLPNINSPREFYDTFDMVVFDEAHEYCSPSRNQIYKIAQCPYMLGLSATPEDRADTLDKINHWGIGPVLIADKIPGYSTKDIAFKGNVIKINYSGPKDYTEHLVNEKLDLTSVPLMIGQLCDDPFRLDMIVDLILEQHKNNMNILVFADRRSYLEIIRNNLDKKSTQCELLTTDEEFNEFEIKDKLETIRLVGGSKESDFILAKEKKNVILSTYQYLSTGVSIPKMTCVVLVTPRKSKSRQIISRIFRLGSNYDIVRQIVDIVDVKTSLKNQWNTRRLYYEEQGYTQEIRKISYEKYA